jgi:hypothetical protein
VAIEVGHRALIKRSREHRQASDACVVVRAPSAMLRFYAAECGLKAAALRRDSLRSTEQLDANLRSHDLVALAKHLRVAAEVTPPAAFALERADSNQSSVATKDVHQAWRYGRELVIDDNARALAAVDRLLDWIDGELS